MSNKVSIQILIFYFQGMNRLEVGIRWVRQKRRYYNLFLKIIEFGAISSSKPWNKCKFLKLNLLNNKDKKAKKLKYNDKAGLCEKYSS